MLAKYPILKIIGSPPSAISQETRAAVLARIRELEGMPRVLTPVANLAMAGPSSNADHQVRERRPILSLEATLRETRTAGRALQAARMARLA
jgi:methyl coenzyme M reductase subunit D